MYPFTLAGPPFLVFYAALMLGLWAAVWLAKRRLSAAGDRPAAGLSGLAGDPYAIACLRNGADEAVRVAVVALIDRGALASDGDGRVALTDDGRRELSNIELERALLQACRGGAALASALPGDPGVLRSTQALEDGLKRQGLLWSPTRDRQRLRLCWAAAAVLLAVSGARVAQTLAAGNSNLGFLLLLTAVALIGCWVMSQGRLTAAGLKQLTHLQGLLGDLRGRAGKLQPGRSSRDVALLAGAFGLAVLPAAAFAFARDVYPPAAGGGADSGSGGSGGDGGDGGSGCGGSGCGGGGSSD